MRDLFFQELKKTVGEIKAMPDKTAGEDTAATVKAALDLADGIKANGLLGSAEWCPENMAHKGEHFLVDMLRIAATGAPAEAVEEIAMTKYYAAGSSGYEALSMLIGIMCIVSIINGEMAYVTKERIAAFAVTG